MLVSEVPKISKVAKVPKKSWKLTLPFECTVSGRGLLRERVCVCVREREREGGRERESVQCDRMLAREYVCPSE